MSEEYSKVLERMRNEYYRQTGMFPDENSDIQIKMKILAGELHALGVNIDWLKRQLNPETADGEYLNYHGSKLGLTRKPPAKASGTVRFYTGGELFSDYVIKAGTLVSTSGKNPVRFETTEAVILSAGADYADAKVRAVEGGSSGNVNTGEVSVMVSLLQPVSKVTNLSKFTGGTDEESDEDFRSRIVAAQSFPATGTNAAYYEKLALSVTGVGAAYVSPQRRGKGTVDIFILPNGAVEESQVLENLEALVLQERELGVDVDVLKATSVQGSVTVTIYPDEGYTFDTVKTNCSEAVQRKVSNLTIGEDLKLSDIGDALYHAQGVYDYKFDSSSSNITAGENRIITGVTLTMKEGV